MAGRVFNVALILVGVSLVFLGIGSLTRGLLEFSLRRFFGRRKMECEIDRLKDHYIIFYRPGLPSPLVHCTMALGAWGAARLELGTAIVSCACPVRANCEINVLQLPCTGSSQISIRIAADQS
jgi:hypothetical protein